MSLTSLSDPNLTGTVFTVPAMSSTYTSTTSSPWSAGAEPEMVKAWMGAVIERLEHLQRRIRELEGKQNGR